MGRGAGKKQVSVWMEGQGNQVNMGMEGQGKPGKYE